MGFLPTTKYKNNERTVSGSVNVENSDMLLNVDTSLVACTINLQSIPNDNWNTLYKLYVKDISGNAGTNNITIVAPTGYKINNSQTLILNTNNESVLIRISSNLDYVSFPNKAGHIIQDEGNTLPQQPILDFVGSGVTVTNGVGKTIVTINDCCDFVELTNSQMLELISNGTVDAGTYYKITNPINADEGVVVQGIVTNANPSLQGSGIFLNADYQNVGDYSGVSGFVGNLNVYGDTPRSVVIGNVVIWNNLHYKNLTGNWGINPDLDPTNWELLPKNVTNGYIREVDFVKYNVYTNRVIYRADKRLNEVDYASFGSSNNILEFQWGKDRVTGNKLKGNGRMTCTNSYATFTNNLIEGTITDSTQVNELIGRYVSNIISNDSYITCNSYNRGIVSNNILTGASYMLLEIVLSNVQITKNNLSSTSYIDINIATTYINFSNNTLQNESYFRCLNLQANISNNSLNNNSWIEIDNCLAELLKNSLNRSYITITTNNGALNENFLSSESVINVTINADNITQNTLNRGDIIVNENYGSITENLISSGSRIQIDGINYASIFRNTIGASGYINSPTNTSSVNIWNNTINDVIYPEYFTDDQSGRVINSGYSNFYIRLGLTDPAVYDLGTQTLTIPHEQFGLIELVNTNSYTISKIDIDNISRLRNTRFTIYNNTLVDTYVTFQHTVIASANSGDLVCDAPSSANTLVGRYFGSDFIEYQKSYANGAGNYVNLRTNLVKLA